MNKVVLFDGVCNFCNASVQFIIKRDPKGVFHFASLQSDIGQELVAKYQLPKDVDSVVLIEDNRAFWKSNAALRIAKHLSGGWKLTSIFLIIPRPLRDIFYEFFASKRYKWFGKQESCMLPPPHLRKRFLSN